MSYKMVIEFPNQDPAFAHGMEVGMIWGALENKVYATQAVRVENREVLSAVAAHFGKAATFVESGLEGWLIMSVEPVKLTVVKG